MVRSAGQRTFQPWVQAVGARVEARAATPNAVKRILNRTLHLLRAVALRHGPVQGCKIHGARATVSFVFFAGQNPAKLWQNLAKFVRIDQKCNILRKSQHFLDNLAKFRQILIGIGAKFVENSLKILIFVRKIAKI